MPEAARPRNLEQSLDTTHTEEETTVFARSARKHVDTAVWPALGPARARGAASPSRGPRASCPDPIQQVELVEAALEKLDAVRLLVNELPELPLGDRQSLIAQLASTADSLRSLTFLDAIY